jgi:hypothetical protein
LLNRCTGQHLHRSQPRILIVSNARSIGSASGDDGSSAAAQGALDIPRFSPTVSIETAIKGRFSAGNSLVNAPVGSVDLGFFNGEVLTTKQARPIEYGVGEFHDSEIDAGHTHIVWTYSFTLKDHEFPGYLGALGRYLFRVGFLDRQYAAMMRGTLQASKATTEEESAGNN